jgi:hypothetical protein
MEPKHLITVVMAVVLATVLSAPVWAQQTGASPDKVNLFKNAGPKQTNKDFRPAPSKIYTDFGTLEFTGGGFPTDATIRKVYDELDLQRATQTYMDFFPALSVYGIVKGQIRDFGFKTASDVGVYADFMDPTELMLTGNDVTLYAVASLDLKIDGPTVVQIPPGMYGTANDAAFLYLTDFGFVGPDKGKGGKYLFLPPGYKGKVPDGYFAIRSPSYRIWAMMRGFGEIGTGDKAVDYFRQNLKIYPLATGPRQASYIQVAGMGVNGLPPEDFTVFEMLNEIIQYEPSDLFSKEQLGRLASLGIEKGKPFNPDARMRGILDQGAKQGVAMARTIVYACRDSEINYWPDRHWEKMFIRNTEFLRNGYRDIDARTLWHYQAIVVSPNLLSTTPGQGTAYLTCFKDEDGIYLDGAKNYRLRVPANMPVKRFWAVTAYDVATRCLLDSDGNITVSSLSKPEVNADGSVDVYFGPKAPKGKEKNWVKTDPAEGFFVVFRFYGPLEGYIDKTWVLNDFELVQ